VCLFLQRAAVRRMMELETSGFSGVAEGSSSEGGRARVPPHPFITKLVTRSGLLIYANLVRTMGAV